MPGQEKSHGSSGGLIGSEVGVESTGVGVGPEEIGSMEGEEEG